MAYSDAGSKSMVLVIVVVGISASLFIALTTSNYPIIPANNGTSTTTLTLPTEITGHAPIHIVGDEDFASQALIESWPGTGTNDTPYVIQGLQIHSEESCIYIENVSVHFQIRFCYLSGGTAWNHAGIHLLDTVNGYIFNCTFSTEVIGIWMDGAQFCIVDTCDIRGAVIGVNLTQSNDVSIRFNHIHQDCIPVGVFFCENIDLQENIIFGCDMALGVFESFEIRIHANTYFDCREGIHFHAIYGWITDNIIAFNDAEGLVLGSSSSGVQVIMNLFGFNREVNAADYGDENIWYDGHISGNYWSDFDGEPPYAVPGSAGSVDPYPQLLTEEYLSEILPYIPDI